MIDQLQQFVIGTEPSSVTDRTLYGAAGINRRTVEAYERLLQALLLVDVVPAWSTNLLKRLVREPKRYLRDTGLAAAVLAVLAVLAVDADGVLRNGDILGRMIETASQHRGSRH